jgi:hypothetical protein
MGDLVYIDRGIGTTVGGSTRRGGGMRGHARWRGSVVPILLVAESSWSWRSSGRRRRRRCGGGSHLCLGTTTTAAATGILIIIIVQR